MEYHPRHPQPFSFSQAIDIALDPEVAWDEIARLRNSLLHLRRSQDELREYSQGDAEVSQAVEENEITIASQDERILMLKLALTHHGRSVTSHQISGSLVSSHSTSPGRGTDHDGRSNSNGLDDLLPDRLSVGNIEVPETRDRENGVYL